MSTVVARWFRGYGKCGFFRLLANGSFQVFLAQERHGGWLEIKADLDAAAAERLYGLLDLGFYRC